MALIRTISKRLALMGGAFCICLAPLAAQAQDFDRPPIELLEAGFFCPQRSVGEKEAPDTERGVINLIEEGARPRFQTTVIPGELGASFGIRFRLAPGTGTMQVEIVNSHPPIGTPPVTVDRYFTTAVDDGANVSIFSFDEPYEIGLGTWTFTVRINGEEHLRQSFTVVPPEDTAVSVALCDGPAMLS